MLVTDLKHVEQQLRLTPGLSKAMAWLRQNAKQDLPDGKLVVDGDNLYVMIQSYETYPAGQTPKFEGHKQYLDVQFIVSGQETIGWAAAEAATVTVPYDEAKDIWLGAVAAEKMTPIRLTAGQMAILWPADAHAPKLSTAAPVAVKKYVVKVAL